MHTNLINIKLPNKHKIIFSKKTPDPRIANYLLVNLLNLLLMKIMINTHVPDKKITCLPSTKSRYINVKYCYKLLYIF